MKTVKKWWWLILALGGLITYYIVDEIRVSRIEDRIPKTTLEMNKITEHVNEIPSDVENYKREVKLIQQGEVLIQQQIKLDSFYIFAEKKFTKDSLTELSKDKSRAGRDSINKVQAQTMREILKFLKDSIQ